jgi:hypothetical protein
VARLNSSPIELAVPLEVDCHLADDHRLQVPPRPAAALGELSGERLLRGPHEIAALFRPLPQVEAVLLRRAFYLKRVGSVGLGVTGTARG